MTRYWPFRSKVVKISLEDWQKELTYAKMLGKADSTGFVIFWLRQEGYKTALSQVICQRLSFVSFRYWLGTFHDTVHFQLLSGIRLGYQKNIYDSIYLSIAVFISAIAITSAYTKVVLVLGLLPWYKDFFSYSTNNFT